MKYKHIIILIIAFISTSKAQDLIVKLDSTKIFCKITKEDSLAIYYTQRKGKEVLNLSIEKAKVQKYFNSNAIAKENQHKIDTAERIYNAKVLKKGLYKNFTEFITNSPSTTKEFTVVERTQADLMFMHGSEYTFKVLGSNIEESDVYGFCDGKDVFINYDHPKGYCKMECIGPYTFFTYTVHGSGALALVPDQLMILDEKGKFMNATVNNVKKILMERNKDLADEYEGIEDKKDKRKEYLTKLNQSLKKKK